MKTPVTLSPDPALASSAKARARTAPAPAFAEAMGEARLGAGVQVRQGDNLTHMVKAEARAAGLQLDESTAYRLALQVARSNGIANPDQIAPGQRVNLGLVQQHVALQTGDALKAPSPPRDTRSWLRFKTAEPSATAAPNLNGAVGSGEILQRTLQRAVDKGFIPAQEQAAVRQRIESLAGKFGFSPDDFALLSLMESDGLNPQASNGSCHGVIQFCEGGNRGAASVGMARQPKAILGMGVLQQLDLVDRYLADAGVRPGAGLDDLYLAVLTPAARAEGRLHAPLPIAGRQASALYVNGDARGTITRHSLQQGLLAHAAARLGLGVGQLQAMRAAEATEPTVATVAQAR